MNDYVHIEAADLCRPNARFTQERQGYQVLTPFGKLGYSPFSEVMFGQCVLFWFRRLFRVVVLARRRSATGFGARWTVMPLGSVANGRSRHMLIGYARVSKADGSQSLDP